MKSLFGVALVAGLLSASQSAAIVTATGPVRSSDDSILGCRALNLGDEPISVSVVLNSGVPGVVEQGTLEIPAGEGRQILSSSVAIFGGYCIFEFNANPTLLRTYISLQDLGGSNTRLLAPAEVIDADAGLINARTFSPPLRSSEGDNLNCRAVNFSTEAVIVEAELDNGLGAVVEDATVEVPAGASRRITGSSTAIFGGFCRFRFSGNPTMVRGYIETQPSGGGNTRLLLPATAIDASATVTPATPTATPMPDSTCPPIPATNTPSAIETCPPATVEPCEDGCCGDCDGDGEVRINELIQAVNFALDGCSE